MPRGSSLVWPRAEKSLLNSSNTNVNSLLFMPRDSVLCLFCLSYNEKLTPPSWLCYPCGCCRPSDSFPFPLRREKVAADSFCHNSFPRVNYLLPSDNPLTNKCIRNRDLLCLPLTFVFPFVRFVYLFWQFIKSSCRHFNYNLLIHIVLTERNRMEPRPAAPLSA